MGVRLIQEVPRRDQKSIGKSIYQYVKTLSISERVLIIGNTKKQNIVDEGCRRVFYNKPPKEQTPKKTLGANLSGKGTTTGHTSGEYV